MNDENARMYQNLLRAVGAAEQVFEYTGPKTTAFLTKDQSPSFSVLLKAMFTFLEAFCRDNATNQEVIWAQRAEFQVYFSISAEDLNLDTAPLLCAALKDNPETFDDVTISFVNRVIAQTRQGKKGSNLQPKRPSLLSLLCAAMRCRGRPQHPAMRLTLTVTLTPCA